MKRLTMFVLIVLMSGVLVGQEKKKVEKDAPPKEIKPRTAAGDTESDPSSIAGLDKQIAAQKAKIEQLTKKNGPKSEQVKRARAALAQLLESRSFLTGHPVIGSDDPSDLADPSQLGGAPGLTSYSREMIEQLLDSAASLQVPDPIEELERVVLTGLENQIESLVADIRKTKDEKSKKKKGEELRDAVTLIVEARNKLREGRIKKLEQQLAALKKQKPDSAEATIKRLLGGKGKTDDGKKKK